ncbi:ornithine carbamoyltransferase [Malassezia cuniculi]|uniref:ornithine carbamoyltransferase n=1 Tax=Malassezia cuniculi TaxID=948313 RepID=A0AAF0EPK5_9BASI|nr:ornithine carbamoyltransferase [Malassezia cuniculi]
MLAFRRVSSALGGVRTYATAQQPRSLLTLADLSVPEIGALVKRAAAFKAAAAASPRKRVQPQSLDSQSIAVVFSKRSTRTRVASETSIAALGGHPMFLAPSDIQLGVNESLYDTAKVLGSMVDGIMARVGGHEEVETLAAHAGVPVINALSSRYHPTQILADLLTLVEQENTDDIASLAGRRIAWVGDSNNILNDMLVTYPRLGMHLSVATPTGEAYARDPVVWDVVNEHGANAVSWTHDPAAAVRDADYIVTDTWVSMGDEDTKEQRLRDFQGFQVTEELAKRGGAQKDWRFLHCLPRKADEVDDEVFYGPRSLVFPEAENRKWTIMACFEYVNIANDSWLFGRQALN